MQHRRGVVAGGGSRARYNDLEDPKYGEKGRLVVTKRGLMTAMVSMVCLCALYLVVNSDAAARGSASATLDRAEVEGQILASPPQTHGKLRSFDSLPPPEYNKLSWTGPDGSPMGYVRIPKIPPGQKTGDDGKLHVIFSSGCNNFQHWQSELLLASAYLAGQRGRITRIVSGCHDKSAETVRHQHQTFPQGKNDLLVPLEILNRSVNENFGLYITPSFDGARDFPWINKLDRLGETVIAILDPDFIFLKPLTQTGESLDNIIISRDIDKDRGVLPPIDVVRKGRPVAQRYGLESGWKASKFDLDAITGDPDTPAKTWTHEMATKYTSVGPPLMLHVDDISRLSVLWEKYMRPVLAMGPNILADMWAYSIGAAHLDLRHTILDHYMISTWGDRGEAFSWVDAWQTMSCKNPQPKPGDKLPTFIHLASNYKAPDEKGPWMFHKGHVPATQAAWVLCHTVAKINRILLMYKQKFCPIGYETRKLVRLIQRKTQDRSCSERTDKWCFPLAQIEGLPDNWRDHAM
ncbi:Peptidyl serine alpha-galactosyltransferase [Hondaea fermentalgiana]|uniref:Peptidyl serine alpha-galactosyltransferase n=1 Tax=Hondaea fermentalgiana TaxID=2315210 RepID=A0A2R5GRA4_9STRA|nr:Peptidyl serine alpha-galactosyltransferase [Hondaea fermentalgiana]|eukprot:GBG33125.1 Peptidyl serine alpha-galactosyltransferase [Hondaea fermentalgiana]